MKFMIKLSIGMVVVFVLFQSFLIMSTDSTEEQKYTVVRIKILKSDFILLPSSQRLLRMQRPTMSFRVRDSKSWLATFLVAMKKI